MRYLKLYENFNNKDLNELFSLVISDSEFFEIPYSYHGSIKNFNIYVVTGSRIESNEHNLVQELYNNHEILKNIYNLDFFHIKLTQDFVTIVLFDYLSKHKDTNYLRKIPTNLFKGLVRDRLQDSFSSYFLHRGIDWSNGHSSNLSLFDWIYESINDNIIEDCRDILIDLSDDGIDLDLGLDKLQKVYGVVSFSIEIGNYTKAIHMEKYKDNFMRLLDYLESLGWSLSSSSYYRSDNWDYLERCPNCNYSDYINGDGESLECGECGHQDQYDEFSTDEYPLTKADLIKCIDKPDFMYIQFSK